MARRVFFSFHYEGDVWRAGVVRNSWVTTDREAAGFWDAAKWEEVKKGGDAAIRKWIDDQLTNTSVTVVLVGVETASREYVGYEIEQSFRRSNGLLAVYIHGIKDSNGHVSTKGSNPFDNRYVTKNNKRVYFSELYKTYDWMTDSGYDNLGKWVEQAASDAGR